MTNNSCVPGSSERCFPRIPVMYLFASGSTNKHNEPTLTNQDGAIFCLFAWGRAIPAKLANERRVYANVSPRGARSRICTRDVHHGVQRRPAENNAGATVASNSHFGEVWTSDGTRCEYGISHVRYCVRLTTNIREGNTETDFGFFLFVCFASLLQL